MIGAPAVVKTPRLTLMALSAEELAQLFPYSAELEATLGIPICEGMLTLPVKRACGVKLSRMRRTPTADRLWLTYWLMVHADVGIGLIGYKGAPDPDGEVEMGYGIDETYWGQGFTTEAVGGMVDWALAQTACRRVTAKVNLDNPASVRVLQKNNFELERISAAFYHYAITKKRSP